MAHLRIADRPSKQEKKHRSWYKKIRSINHHHHWACNQNISSTMTRNPFNHPKWLQDWPITKHGNKKTMTVLQWEALPEERKEYCFQSLPSIVPGKFRISKLSTTQLTENCQKSQILKDARNKWKKVNEDATKWPKELLGSRDIFYEISLSKEESLSRRAFIKNHCFLKLLLEFGCGRQGSPLIPKKA